MKELVDEYENLGYKESFERRYNSHNQYLGIMLDFGIVGLLIWILSITYPAFYAFKLNYNFYIIFVLMFCLSCMTENYLGRFKGVAFFAFFNTLLSLPLLSGKTQN